MLAQKLSELSPSLHITVVEAGRSIFDVENRGRYRERAIAYGEHPWPDDYVEDQQAEGIISMTMAVGGLALHWGGACNRFSEEDLRLKSMYGLAVDWPIEWRELERYYCEAERRLNVAGEPSAYPQDKRTEPYPQPPIPLSFNLQLLKRWAEQSGLKFDSLPKARYPNGLANRSGLVGRYMNGHKFVSATANIDDQTFPGQNMTHSLISREYFRCGADKPFVRHDTRVWESSAGRDPRLRTPDGRLLLGDELMADWRSRTKGSSVRLRAYVDVHPSADSRLTLDRSTKNRYGDPMPKIEHRFDEATLAREAATKTHVLGVFNTLARASNGRIVSTGEGDYLDHPGGGCRMGADPATSVCDSFGRTHDHENLFVVGAPTTPTGGCTNGTLTFVALTLRSADEIALGFSS